MPHYAKSRHKQLKSVEAIKMGKSSAVVPRILHVATHAGIGGAGKACLRIFDAQRSVGLESRLFCLQASRDDPLIDVFEPANAGEKLSMAKRLLDGARSGFKRSGGGDIVDDRISEGVINFINEADCDLVHLHWINGMLSIPEIALINKPIVWTLHDMWIFLGNQHHTEELDWMTGYQDRAEDDAERKAWVMKSSLWQQPSYIVGPSTWITRCAQKSALTSGWPSTVIPHPLCVSTWNPVDPMDSRKTLGLPTDKILVLYGAVGGTRDPNKAFDFLLSALQHLLGWLAVNVVLVIFGESNLPNAVDSKFPMHFFGPIQDDCTLRLIYSAADVVVVPSRIEAFGQIALEAQACGTSVVAFNNSGLSDVIAHKSTGYLAQAFDVKDLARGIEWCVDAKEKQEQQLRARCRERVITSFSNEIVGNQYAKLYRKLVTLNN